MTEHEKRIREALEAGPTEGPFLVIQAESAAYSYDVMTEDGYYVATAHGLVRGEDNTGEVTAAFIAACNPSAIRALLADLDAARAALSEAKAGGWVSPYDSVPQPDQTVLVWSRQTWETAPSLKIDTWAMQREAPLSFSTATIETGYGWDDHEDFESVIAWQPLPAPPAQRGEG